MDTEKLLSYLLLFVLGIFMFVLTYRAVLDINTGSWAFIGHDYAIAFLPAVPWILLISLCAPSIYMIIRGSE